MTVSEFCKTAKMIENISYPVVVGSKKNYSCSLQLMNSYLDLLQFYVALRVPSSKNEKMLCNMYVKMIKFMKKIRPALY